MADLKYEHQITLYPPSGAEFVVRVDTFGFNQQGVLVFTHPQSKQSVYVTVPYIIQTVQVGGVGPIR